MGKKALCLIFAFLFSINSFAAVVSDNDGSAFVTKAEFDSLKNNFQSQLNQYNENIDSKIDNAIASYLSGVTIGKEHIYDSIFKDFGETEIKSVRASEVTFQEDLPLLNLRYGVGDAFANGSSLSHKVLHGQVNFTHEVKGKRGVVWKKTIGTNTLYFYKGWCDDYYNTFDTLIFFNSGPNVDTGYNVSVNGGCWGFWYNTNGLTDRGGYTWDIAKWCLACNYDGQQNVYQPYKGTDYWYSWTFHEPIKQQHNYIYRDDTTSGVDSTTYELRLTESMEKIIPGTTAIWWDEFVRSSTTIDSKRYVANGVDRTLVKKTSAYSTSSPYYTNGGKSYMPIAAPVFKNGTNWNNIYYNDTTLYKYKSSSGERYLQYYRVTGGIPLVTVDKGDSLVEWEVEFKEDDPHCIYVKYEPFGNAAYAPECISVSDNKELKDAEKWIWIGKKGKIYFKATDPGLIFVKWCTDDYGGGTLDVDKSSKVKVTEK